MNRLTALLSDHDYILFDGGMGTLLQERGLDDGGAGELWNVERPDDIRAIHEEYAEAGADDPDHQHLRRHPPAAGHARPRRPGRGAQRGRRARSPTSVAKEHGILVAGDLGPTGELLAPLGTLSAADAQALFEEQLRGLVAGGIDLVLIETMSDLGEVRGRGRRRPRCRARPADRRDPELRHQPAHDDGRLARRRRARTRGGRRRRRRRQLRPRPGRDGGHRRGDGRRAPTDVLLVAQSNAGLPEPGRRPLRVRRPGRRARGRTPRACTRSAST